MKKSHTFRLRSNALALITAFSSVAMLGQSNDGVQNVELFPEKSTPEVVEVSGIFSMEVTWTGVQSRIESINWDNFGLSNSGSAYLRILDAEGTELYTGYPTERSNGDHQFEVASVFFETGFTYTLEFDLNQTSISIYSNNVFPWRPDNADPIDIESTELIGVADQPVDPDKVFPYFTMNMVYGVGLEETTHESWATYPNPATDWISLPELTTSAQVDFYSVSGQLVHSESAEANQSSISTSTLAAGMYIVAVRGENGGLIARSTVTVE
ncbi:MAG: T9SS type A sorting domain-containing protein [Bacteroidetes bacterium]|nr:MAG: T9SS type A sorting domain-containing protein [Bacteroidota bacterium]